MQQLSEVVQNFVARMGELTPSPANESAAYECAKCRDQGSVPVLDGEEVSWTDSRLVGALFTAKTCECVKKRRMERMFASSHITEEFRQVGFRGFVVDGRPACVKDARDVALDYYHRFEELRSTDHNSCTLVGPPGSGKTRLLMAVANGLMRKGVGVHYFPWVEGVGELLSDMDGLQDRLNIMKTVDVLFLDDLYKGRVKPTEFTAQELFGVVNYRYNNRKPMLISSERIFGELFQVDAAIARRVWERSKGHRVVMGLTDAERAQSIELNYSLVEA